MPFVRRFEPSVPVLVFILFVLTGPLSATRPMRWIDATFEDFQQGELEGVSLTSNGRLILAPAFDSVIDTEEPFVHSAVADASGNIYAGTGSNGRIFKIQPNSSAAEWADLPEASVYALALDSSNRLYAATSPDGKVYRLDSQGQEQLFFDPEDKFIWSLTSDSRNNLYVGTGPRGIIYRVNAEGQSSVFFDSNETHVMMLEWDLDQALLAGTAPGGLLFRIDDSGRPLVLYDSSLEEVKAVSVDRYGNIYAAVLSGKTAQETETASGQSPSGADPDTAESTVQATGTAQGGKLEVIKIDRKNLPQRLYTSQDQLAYDVHIRDDGSLLVATGHKGRILSIDPERFVTILVETSEQQITRLIPVQDSIFAATSNLGKVFKLTARPAEKGRYESRLLDAGVPASWGRISWEITDPSQEQPALFTRSGNTAQPDETWNDWKGPYRGSGAAPIESSPARYLQWKVEFPTSSRSEALLSSSNALELVAITYLQQNSPPVLAEVTVHAPGVALVNPPSVNPSGGLMPGGPGGVHARSLPPEIRKLEGSSRQIPPRTAYVPGSRSLSWTASDPNGDDLLFKVECRRRGETHWRVIADNVSENHYTIDGASLADGTYFARVTVSDRASNPSGQALETRLETKPFVIANSVPRLQWDPPQVEGSAVRLSVLAETSGSGIYQAEYSVDGRHWMIIFPEDGIADSTQERFSFTVEDLPPGSHTITVRIIDLVGNLGTGQVSVVRP